jgi:hypothetical protein
MMMTMTTAVKERPILFSGPMVRAILDGRKTQTRRIIKPQPHPLNGNFEVCHYYGSHIDRHGIQQPDDDLSFGICDVDGEWGIKCPFGQDADHLWVRESWSVSNIYDNVSPSNICVNLPKGPGRPPTKVLYPATDSISDCIRRRPSIHMPRWASRITLEISGVRVERLQNISLKDAIAEGVEWNSSPTRQGNTNPKSAFKHLWEQINGEGAWHANPWVWVIEFKKIT